MKKMIFIVLPLLFGVVTAQAQTQDQNQDQNQNQNQEQQSGPFYEYKDWSASLVENHEFWGGQACVATTVADDNVTRLEVVALFDGTAFTEPTVQILSPMSDVFFEVQVDTVGRSSTFHLLPLFSSETQNAPVAAVVKMEEREALVNAIAAKSRLTAKYIDAQGVVREVTFSLRGSSATLRETFKQCGLSFGIQQRVPVFRD